MENAMTPREAAGAPAQPSDGVDVLRARLEIAETVLMMVTCALPRPDVIVDGMLELRRLTESHTDDVDDAPNRQYAKDALNWYITSIRTVQDGRRERHTS